jgi:hypothetical protein
MKKSHQRHSRIAARAVMRRGEHQLQAALRAQRPDAPDLFSDRIEDDVEYASLLRDFQSVQEEALGAECYS